MGKQSEHQSDGSFPSKYSIKIWGLLYKQDEAYLQLCLSLQYYNELIAMGFNNRMHLLWLNTA